MRSVKGVKFAMVPMKVFLDPSNAALRVWCGLSMFANHDNVCWPSQRALAEYLGVSQAMVCRGLDDLKTMKMVTVEDAPTGRKYFRLHMGGDSPVHQGDSPMNQGDSPVQEGDSPMNQNFDENPLHPLAPEGVAMKWPPAIDSRTRSMNQTHEAEAAAVASLQTTTATAGLTGIDIDEFWHSFPIALATNRAKATAIWAGLDNTTRAAVCAAAKRYKAVFSAAADHNKAFFRHAPAFMSDGFWTLSDNEWRIAAREPVPFVPDTRPPDAW